MSKKTKKPKSKPRIITNPAGVSVANHPLAWITQTPPEMPIGVSPCKYPDGTPVVTLLYYRGLLEIDDETLLKGIAEVLQEFRRVHSTTVAALADGGTKIN